MSNYNRLMILAKRYMKYHPYLKGIVTQGVKKANTKDPRYSLEQEKHILEIVEEIKQKALQSK